MTITRSFFGSFFGSFFVAPLFALSVACTASTSPESGDGGSSPATSASSTPDGGSAGLPAASSKEAPVEIGAACPAFEACSATLSGTYDYVGGCVGDAFAAVRKVCPTVDTSGVKVSVQGSLHFMSGGALVRDAKGTLAGVLKVPATCSQGQCAIVEKGLRDAGFASASCTGSAACDCTVARTDTTKNQTTYTLDGSTVTTADGDTYSVCEKAGALTYAGKSAGAEEGTWKLTKR